MTFGTGVRMTFGTCQVSDAWVLFIPMETIRKEFVRRSIPIYWIGLAGMAGLGYFFIHHPTQYAMPVFLAYMAALVIISQMICWEIKAGEDAVGVTPSPRSAPAG